MHVVASVKTPAKSTSIIIENTEVVKEKAERQKDLRIEHSICS